MAADDFTIYTDEEGAAPELVVADVNSGQPIDLTGAVAVTLKIRRLPVTSVGQAADLSVPGIVVDATAGVASFTFDTAVMTDLRLLDMGGYRAQIHVDLGGGVLRRGRLLTLHFLGGAGG